jgi:hypothetical protein
MNTDDYFFKLASSCTVEAELLEYCANVEDWAAGLTWESFLQKLVPDSIIKKDKFLTTMKDMGWRIYILKLIPMSWYKFHIDTHGNRPTAINCLLGSPRSLSVFKGKEVRRLQEQILDLNYERNAFYLFNGLEQHAVFNFESDRFLLTITPPDSYMAKQYDPSKGSYKDAAGNFTVKSFGELDTMLAEQKTIYFKFREEFKKLKL